MFARGDRGADSRRAEFPLCSLLVVDSLASFLKGCFGQTVSLLCRLFSGDICLCQMSHEQTDHRKVEIRCDST